MAYCDRCVMTCIAGIPDNGWTDASIASAITTMRMLGGLLPSDRMLVAMPEDLALVRTLRAAVEAGEYDSPPAPVRRLARPRRYS
jgi:hypothetical protein